MALVRDVGMLPPFGPVRLLLLAMARTSSLTDLVQEMDALTGISVRSCSQLPCHATRYVRIPPSQILRDVQLDSIAGRQQEWRLYAMQNPCRLQGTGWKAYLLFWNGWK